MVFQSQAFLIRDTEQHSIYTYVFTVLGPRIVDILYEEICLGLDFPNPSILYTNLGITFQVRAGT